MRRAVTGAALDVKKTDNRKRGRARRGDMTFRLGGQTPAMPIVNCSRTGKGAVMATSRTFDTEA
jgi:hypothetical protein